MALRIELLSRRVGRLARLGTLLVGLAFAAGSAEAATFTVNSLLDTDDATPDGTCDSGGGVCTLREAIRESNFVAAPPHIINFNIAGGGVRTIVIGSALPPITQQVTIDGYSQPLATPNSLAVGNNGVLLIELNGAATLSGANGLTVNAAGTTIRGLVINRFAAYGILVNAAAATIRGNFVGTNAAGTAALGNSRLDATAGIGFFGGGATLGGTAPADRNLVSGHNVNGARGIQFWDSSGNTIQGNYVGTNAAGTAALPNIGAGLALDGTAGIGSDNNLVGGTVAGAGNLFARGGNEGVAVYTGSTGNAILGNGISLNTGLGIDLGGNGVTGNDALDGDGGPNNQLNFPVISNVSVLGTSLVVSYSLDVPAGSYRVEFFKNPSGVDVPNGEGEVFAGFQNVTHGGAGSQSFSATFPGASGDRITATTTLCTDGGVCAAFSDTSEFSANLIATATNYRSIGTAPDDSTGSVNTTNGSQFVAGVGTSWVAINRGRGDVISICDQLFPTCTTSTNYTVVAVASDTQITLTTPYTGSTGNHGYTIRRQFRGGGNAGQALVDWENCIDGGPCTYFGAGVTSSLVNDNRREVGIAYKDSVFTPPAQVLFLGATTDATRNITLTADGINRHNGAQGAGVVIDGLGQNRGFRIEDNNYTIEWLEFQNIYGVNDIASILIRGGAASQTGILLQNLLIHDFFDGTANVIKGIGVQGSGGKVATIRNVMIWNGDQKGIEGDAVNDTITIENCTVHGMANYGIDSFHSQFIIRNTIATGNPSGDFVRLQADGSLTGSNNTSSDLTAAGPPAVFANPQTSVAAASLYLDFTGPVLDLHLQPGAVAVNSGLNLSASFGTDVDGDVRPAGPWDRGADEVVATALFRSVGTNGGVLASGAANALTISGSTATFASGLPANIGVGDVIQYDSDGNSSIDALAFIHGRTNAQTYTVANKNGAAPTAVVADNNWAIYRAYTSLANWESQAENLNILEPVENDVNPLLDLVSSNTTMNVACYGDGDDTTAVNVNSWTTGIGNYIRIYTPYLASEVGTSQRHSGTWNTTTAYRLQAAVPGVNTGVLWLRTNYVRVDGLQVWHTADVDYSAAIYMNGAAGVSSYDVSNNIVRGIGGSPSAPGRLGINTFQAGTAGSVANIWNNLVYNFNGIQLDVGGIAPDDLDFTFYVYNNTVVDGAQGIVQYSGTVVAKNNLCYNNLDNYNGTFSAASTNNLSGPAADPQIPATNKRDGVTVAFVNAALDDFHLAGGDTGALDQGANLSADAKLAILSDIDQQNRVPVWDIGADDASGTTAVKLMSFEARPFDSGVSLSWQTASELDNLGFHVYRALSANGPWSRLSASLIPGLGSSAIGRAYSFRDGGLRNGVRYFYRLDDVDASSKTTSHGPVSAVPLAGAADDAPGSEVPGTGQNAKRNGSSTCPAWVLAAYGSATASLRCTRHGEPDAVSLDVVSRDARSTTLELKTGGFYALREPAGTVRVFVPGFDFPQDERAAALPIRRALAEAVVGRRAQLGGVRALDVVSYRGLVPSGLGRAEMQVGDDGTVRASRRVSAREPRRFPKSELVTLLPSQFQGERKSAVVEIAPLRFDAQRQQLVLAKRVRVRLLFTGRELGESGRGSLGRATRARKPPSGEILARLYTTSVGLHAVGFEQLFPGRARGFAASQLRLERQGEPVSFHLEPAADAFGPGSRLYFHAERSAASTDFTAEVAYELVSGPGGIAMPLQFAAPLADAVATAPSVSRSFETNRFYQPGLLEAPDLWLWEAVASGATRVKAFSLAGVAPSGSAELDIFLQGASESGQAVDHHVSVSVNGAPVGEARFAGKQPYRLSLSLPASLLREGTNELSLTNVADTGVTSMVFLDRFAVVHPQPGSLASGLFEGTWAESGTATVSGISGSAALVDVSATGAPTWLTGHQTAGGSVHFHAEAGHRYRVASQAALVAPRVAAAAPATLRTTTNQADYLLIAPRAFLAAAEPLVQRRQDQGLRARAVALEEIADAFGHGLASAEAIQRFLAYAFQSWARPSPRYVLLLGDSTYDPRNFTGTSQPSPLPALWTKTSYLWTVSDPLLAAVNGEDALPDLAIGRLPAATAEQAQMLVEKLIAWEDSGQGLAGQATLVADNPDIAGDFETDVRDIARSYLAGRSDLLLLRELGADTRPRVLDALNAGLSYLAYVGHGGAAVWASENVWNSWDAASLQAQSQQPLLLTLNCLNGYFVAPSYDSLAESLLKADGRGAIAAFSPSGLSLDGPAHQYHRALMAELTSGRHQRLGDAVLAAQQAYAQSGLMPELVSVYHLLGDPATGIR